MIGATDTNALYYGDNLDILRRYVKDETVDLVYLDPPFNSKATYNVLFHEKDGTDAAAQIEAFDDSWTWDQAAASMYRQVVEAGGPPADALLAFRRLPGTNDMLAYLAMMAPRLVELRGPWRGAPGNGRRRWRIPRMVGDIVGGLTVVDVSEPAAPRIVATASVVDEVEQLALSGTTLYVVTQGGSLYIFDVSVRTAVYLPSAGR
jgi:hypothetical protein